MNMHVLNKTVAGILLFAGLFGAAPLHAQNGPPKGQMEAISALEEVLISGAGIDSFIAGWLDPGYRTSVSEDSMRAHILLMHQTVANAQALDLERAGDGIHLIFSAGAEGTVKVRFTPGDAGLINWLELEVAQLAAEMSADATYRQVRRTRVRAVEALGNSVGEAALDQFMETHMTPELRSKQVRSTWHKQLGALQKTIATADVVQLSESNGAIVLAFRGSGNADVLIELDEAPPHLLTMMDINFDVDISNEAESGVEIAPITWETLEQRLVEEAEAGVSGAVLIVRDGSVVLEKGFGLADRDTGRRIDTATVFDLGSIPIDFTRAAILKLADDGLLSLTTPLSDLFPDVPADKAAMTIEHLLTSQSGLPNFHHRAAKDEDFDLTWIDRAEALRRIFEQPLLFAPGTSRAPSHSAFVLLAAIVEQVSGESYPAYLESTFFAPIGMQHTGFYGADPRFRETDMAVGYGSSRVGVKNIPLHWGPTSWLIMGSGGMVSTLGDLHSWMTAVYSGAYLSDEAMRYYGRTLKGGGISDRGFLVLLYHDANATLIYMTNNHDREGDRAMTLGEALMALVSSSAE